MTRSGEYMQHVVRPGDWSLAGFITCLVLILVDIYLVRHQNSSRDRFASFTSDPQTSRRIFAAAYMIAAIFSATVVMIYQDVYFTNIHKSGLRNARVMPHSKYPWLYEEYLDRMPQVFQMMHLRAWAGEAATPKPEWGYFLWWSQQYFGGLISFAFFLLTQSHVRRLKTITMLAFVWVAMTSLSCAHCLLFGFILLTPPSRGSSWFDIEWLHMLVGVVSLAHHVFARMMMYTLNSPLFQRSLLFTSIFPMMLPLISWILPKVNNHHRRLISISEAQTKVFATTGILSMLLHAWSTYLVFFRTVVANPANRSHRLYLNQSDVRDHFMKLSLLDFLNHDPALTAMSLDVVLSLVFLLSWIVVSLASLWGIIKCSINPFLETGQRTVWDNRHDLGAALLNGRNRDRAAIMSTEPPPRKMLIVLALWALGGLGFAAPAVLGCGPTMMDI
ncbi:unnamed protein product [Aureobasidium mustum]|uniref:Uncharacterized protein n=1 Tax=Aureobasidium mustum TaxID=2773714 RepID=A0A9N8JHW1_9PEZI|nr:unnamed protein product [Aureobasidium mustum]